MLNVGRQRMRRKNAGVKPQKPPAACKMKLLRNALRRKKSSDRRKTRRELRCRPTE